MRLLEYRQRSRAELERRLCRAGHPAEAIEQALVRCDDLGYIDDAAFAAAHVRDRLKFRPRGRRILMAELRTRGVAPEVGAAAIEEVFADTGVRESELADELAGRRASRLSHLPRAVAGRRLTAYLVRRGFPSEVVRRAVNRALDSATAD